MESDVEALTPELRTLLSDPEYPPMTINQRLVAKDHGWLARCGCCLNAEGMNLRTALLSQTKE